MYYFDLVSKVNKKKKREWWLYSALAVLSVLTFVSICSTSAGSTEQVIAGAFSALVGMFLFVSQQWKEMNEQFHMSMVLVASGAFLIWFGCMFWQNNHE